jgi:hypothetical protein
MNVARVCKICPSALPHEYLGFPKFSLQGMFISIELLTKVMEEEKAASEKTKEDSNDRIAKHNRNK